MSNPITTGSHPKLLWPGIHALAMNSYNNHPDEWREIFDVFSSSMAYEEEVEMSAFDLAQVKTEGASTVYTGLEQGPTKRYTHVAWSLGYIITKEALADNLYKSKSMRLAPMLSRSFKIAKEMVHANILNRGFTASYAGIDGKELVATDHPVAGGGTQSNELAVAADLSEASLEDMLTMVMEAKNSKGHPIALKATGLIVPPSQVFNAARILESTGQNDTSNNATNAIRALGMVPKVIVNHYLTDSDAWFIKTDAPNGLQHFVRQSYEFSQDNDFDTDNAKAKGYERYAAGWTEWRSVFGTAGA